MRDHDNIDFAEFVKTCARFRGLQCGAGYPHEQSREYQIMIAERVRDATGGYGSWPACAAKLGLPT